MGALPCGCRIFHGFRWPHCPELISGFTHGHFLFSWTDIPSIAEVTSLPSRTADSESVGRERHLCQKASAVEDGPSKKRLKC